VDAHTFTKQAEKFKQTSACQKADGYSFLGQDRKGVLMVEFMQQETTVTSEVSILRNRKNCIGPFRTKGVEL
jgi:hypothetical protein